MDPTTPTKPARPPSELDAPLDSKRMVVNLGPSHPAMHGVTRAVVELDGEIITDMKLDIGFLHRGFEKSCENVTWTQCFPYTDRLNYVSSIMNNVGFALAVEKLCKLEVPERVRHDGRIDLPLLPVPRHPERMQVPATSDQQYRPEALDAETEFTVERTGNGHSLLRVRARTGVRVGQGVGRLRLRRSGAAW